MVHNVIKFRLCILGKKAVKEVCVLTVQCQEASDVNLLTIGDVSFQLHGLGAVGQTSSI